MPVWCDYSWSRPDVAKYDGVLRYLETGSSRPDLTADEAKALHSKNKPISPIWETTAGAAREGFDRGVEHAKRANAAADALGMSADAVIWYTVDSDLDPLVVAPYFDGVESVPGRRVGIYGSFRIVEWAAARGIDYRWQTLAWSGGKVSDKAHLYQNVFLSSIDENQQYRWFPAWEPSGWEDPMGGLPTPSTPGYTTFRGFTCCTCLAQWLPVYERLLLQRGLIKMNIDVWQLTGNATASAGTHSKGGVFDLLYQTLEAHAMVAREMGARATWVRPYPQFSRKHLHGVLTGCPHNSPAAYQISAVRAGYNGLGSDGRAGPDPHPDPSADRTWVQGIEWALAQLEDDMAAEDVWTVPLGTNPATDVPVNAGYSLEIARNYAFRAWQETVKSQGMISALAQALKVLTDAHNADVSGDDLLAAVKEAVAAEMAQVDEKVEAALSDVSITLTAKPDGGATA